MFIVVAIPAYGGAIKNACAMSIFRLTAHLNNRGIKHTLQMVDAADPAVARNMLVADAYETKFTHLLSVDSDMEFQPSAFDRMIAANAPLIGCIYPSRNDHGFVVETLNAITISAKGVAKVAGIGMGLALIQRVVFDTLAPTVTKRMARGKETLGFFDCIMESYGPLSEDLSFCRRWREAGHEVLAIVDEDVGHVGEITYRRSYVEHLKATATSQKIVGTAGVGD